MIHDEASRAAALQARAAALNARVAGMVAENDYDKANGYPLTYRETDFDKACNESGCDHNGIVGLLIHGDL